jgi:hypothetical protein
MRSNAIEVKSEGKVEVIECQGGIRCNGRGVRENGEGDHGGKHNCGSQEVPRYGAEREWRGASR